MENAFWRGRVYTAAEVSQSYELEKEIRKASGRKELICTDPDCPNPILKYCHGEIKNAYFAHLDNCDCDYATFDKENTQLLRQVKRTIYENFTERGFDVQLEVKLLPHHYTHLLFTLDNDKKIAVELGTQRTTANKIENLSKQYNAIGIESRWIVISNSQVPTKENETFFVKRYLLNESALKDVLILSWDGTEITQYIVDPNRYLFRGSPLHSDNYPDIYLETGGLSDLVFEDDILTLGGFHARYNEWLTRKQNAFNKKINQLEEEAKIREKRMREHNSLSYKYEPYNKRYNHTYSYKKDCPKAEPGMKLMHKQYGELTIIEVKECGAKTIITVEDKNGEVSSKTWNILWEMNMIEIV